MFMLMLFMFCFFLGFVIMFYYLLARLDNQSKALSDEHAQLRVLLRALESRLEKMGQMERYGVLLQNQAAQQDGEGITMTQSEGVPGTPDEPGHDPLLHLSFDQPSQIQERIARDLELRPPAKNWDLDLLPDAREK